MSAEAPFVPPAGPPTAAARFQHTRWFLVAYYLLALLWGVRNGWFWVPSRLDVLVPAALYAAGGWWAVVDSRARGHALSRAAQQWLFVAGGFLLPGYVIWSRGWRGLGYVLLHGALGCVAAAVAMNIVGWLAVRGEWPPFPPA